MSTRLKVIAITVVLALAGTAAAVAVTLGMQRGTSVAATINGEVIYRSELDREITAIARQYGIDLTSEQGRGQRDEIVRIVLDQMIDQRLILQEARRQNALATDAQVDQAVDEIKANFPSEAEFAFALDQRELTLNDLRERLRTTLTVQNLQAKVSTAVVTEEEIRKSFQANRAEYDRPAQVRVRHILVESEAEARLALARLGRGEKFEELAAQLSKDPGSKDQGGDLGFVARGQLVPEFEEAAFALRPGQVSAPVKTQFGYHIIQLLEHKAAQPSTLDQVREQIRRQLLTQKQEADFTAWLKQIRQQAKITRGDAATK